MDRTNTVERRESLSFELEETLAAAKTDAVEGLGDFLTPVLMEDEKSALGVSLDLYRRTMAWARESRERGGGNAPHGGPGSRGGARPPVDAPVAAQGGERRRWQARLTGDWI